MVVVFWIVQPTKSKCSISREAFFSKLLASAESSCIAQFESNPYSKSCYWPVFCIAFDGNQRYNFSASSATTSREWDRFLADFGLTYEESTDRVRYPRSFCRVDVHKFKLNDKSFDEIVSEWAEHTDCEFLQVRKQGPLTFTKPRASSLLIFGRDAYKRKAKRAILRASMAGSPSRFIPDEADAASTGWEHDDCCRKGIFEEYECTCE